jgi:hypothetical protein
MEVPEFLKEIANAFGSIPGVEAVAWCGSAAMRVADAHSDFDFYVYTNAPVPVESRRAVILERSRHSQLNNTFWELEDEWIDGEGRRFNAMYRSCDFVLGEIAARLEHYSADLGYTTAYCFSVANALEDIPRLCTLAGSLSSLIIEQVTAMLERLDRWLQKNGI